MKKTLAVLLAAVLIALSAGCGKAAPEAEKTVQITATLSKDEKYNAAILSVSPDDFSAAGFQLGDSCKLVFAHGLTIEDVPFYNGYYVKNGAPVLVAYPGFDDIRITYNNMGIWDSQGLTDGETVTVTLAEAQKYADIQQSLGQQYSFDRSAYTSDVQFCNFRALTGGRLKENVLFRGATPVDNTRGRAAYTDALLAQNNIAFVMDLADSEADMQGYLAAEDFASPYTKSLYENGKVLLLDMSSSFQSEAYKASVAKGLQAMLAAGTPGYIHCTEGKDRTGFVCTLIEALAGASYEEMRADYMVTYDNYFSVTEEEAPGKYNAIAELYFDAFAAYLHGTEDVETLKAADYTEDAKQYLLSGGMTEDEIASLIAMITE